MKYTKMSLLLTLKLKYVIVSYKQPTIIFCMCIYMFIYIVLFWVFFAEKESVFMMTKLHDGKKYVCKTNCNMCG